MGGARARAVENVPAGWETRSLNCRDTQRPKEEVSVSVTYFFGNTV